MNHTERSLIAIRSWAGTSALRIVNDYGADMAPDLIAECADVFLRSLAAVTSPQEARDRMEQILGGLPVPRGGKPELVVNNVA